MQATEVAVVVLRWRAVGSRCVFVDALGDDGIELQLCFADGQLAADELSAGARLRVTARLEPLSTRRGLAAYAFRAARAERGRRRRPRPAPPRRRRRSASAGRGGCDDAGCAFRHAWADDDERRRSAAAARALADAAVQRDDDDDPYEDGDQARHGARHSEFAAWLVATFGAEALRAGVGVLDIAGGRGGVAFELSCRRGIPTTLVEPRDLQLDRRARRFVRKAGVAPFAHVRALLDAEFEASAEGAALLRSCSALVGLHSDEATEAIVDFALKWGKPFAVLPCCVFPRLFPHRRAADGGAVKRHREFCEFLQAKAAGIEAAHLPFEGRNRVIYRRCGAAPEPERPICQPCEAYEPNLGWRRAAAVRVKPRLGRRKCKRQRRQRSSRG